MDTILAILGFATSCFKGPRAMRRMRLRQPTLDTIQVLQQLVEKSPPGRGPSDEEYSVLFDEASERLAKLRPRLLKAGIPALDEGWEAEPEGHEKWYRYLLEIRVELG